MSEYFDKEKFTGNTPPPQRPPQKKQDDLEWLKWPLIIILFSVGLWPLAIIAIAYFNRDKKTVKRAKYSERETRERVERALRQAEARVAQARERVAQETASTTRPTVAQETATKKKQDTHKQAESKRTERKKPAAKSEEKSKENKTIRALRIVGICLLVIGAIIALDSAASGLQGYSAYLEDLFVGLGFLAGGGVSLGRSQYLTKMSRRTKRYILAIGAAETMRMDEIAKRVGRTTAQATKELEKLIEQGYLGEDAYIDHEKGCFARFGATVEDASVVTEVPKEAEEGYSGILRNLRTANDRIPDAELSEKIERLEQISALIFKEVEAHPEKRDRIRTFFDYYLPTTQKLLDTYAEFDEMGVEGENLTQAKERIEQMMDAIVEGFEHQLDQLYKADAMDVVSDIKVMETMLSRDTASAAKDFGYATAKKPAEKDELKPQQFGM